MLAGALPGVLEGLDRDSFAERLDELGEAGVPADLARRVASMPALLSAFDIVEDAVATDRPQAVVMSAYFAVGARLGLDWLRDRILELPRADRWQALARAALRDELYLLHRSLTRGVLMNAWTEDDRDAMIDAWQTANRAGVERALSVLADVRSSGTFDTTTLPVALRELKDLSREDLS